jgi:hypothetical protein
LRASLLRYLGGGSQAPEHPLMARLRHADEALECPLAGVDRKSQAEAQTDAIDP